MVDEPDEIAQAVSEAERASSEGDHAGAEQALRRALWLQEARFGVVHPEVANTLNNLGVVCDILGRPDEAEFLYRRALGLARTTLPAGHPYIATSLENLSALYETQGRPEKLALLGDGDVSRSGLPIDQPKSSEEPTDDAAVEAEASESEDLVGGTDVETSESASSGGSHPTGPPPTATPHPFDTRRLLPAVQMLATASILLLVGWWLFSGTGEPRTPGPMRDALVTPTTSAPSTDRRDEEAARVAEAAPAGASEPELAPERDPEAAPADDATPVAVESPPDPPPSGSPNDTDVSSVVVVESQICSSLVTRDNDGGRLRDWLCDEVIDFAEPGELYFYTRIRSPRSLTVEHRWLRDGVVEQTIDLDVTVNSGLGYRTYSTIAVSSAMSGAWRVELRAGDQAVLRVEEFVVLP